MHVQIISAMFLCGIFYEHFQLLPNTCNGVARKMLMSFYAMWLMPCWSHALMDIQSELIITNLKPLPLSNSFILNCRLCLCIVFQIWLHLHKIYISYSQISLILIDSMKFNILLYLIHVKRCSTHSLKMDRCWSLDWFI